MTFDIQIIPFGLMRYPSVGDYWIEGDVVKIRVAKLGCWKFEALVLIHELVEFFIITRQKIPISRIDRFDIAYEKKRKIGDFREPGDDVKCPYGFAHGIATGVERIVAAALGVYWKDYSDRINAL